MVHPEPKLRATITARSAEAGETVITAAEADCNVFGSEREALFPQENR